MIGALACAALVAPRVRAQQASASDTPRITLSHQIELKAHYRGIVEAAVRGELSAAGVESAQTPLVTVKLEFDEKRLADDATKYTRGVEGRALQQLLELTKPKAESNEAKDEASAQLEVPTSNGVRFGKLNLDLSREQFGRLMAQRKAPSALAAASGADPKNPVTVSVQLAELARSPRDVFRFDPADYLASIVVEIALPAATPSELDDRIKTRVVEALALSSLDKNKNGESVTISRLVEPKPVPKVASAATREPPPELGDWTRGLLAPGNMTLGLIAAVILLGVFVLLATFLLAKVFASVASGIRELKPKEEAQSAGAGDGAASAAVEEAHSTPDAHAEAAPSAGPRRDRHDPAASAKALTSEMKTIRDTLQEIATENEQLFAELLRDLFYQPGGLEDIRDLLSFAGYKCIKPGLDRLPKQSIEELQAFIEESRDAPASLLNGVEVAQRLYRQCISKITASGAQGAELDRLRAALVGAEDIVLRGVVKECDPAEISLLLKTLTVERGNRLVKLIPPEALKAATSLLDDELPNASELVDRIVKRLASAAESQTRASQAQLRFILRLARGASIDEEAAVLEMVGPEEWSLKREIMRARFFFAWAPHVPLPVLKSVLDSLPVRARAEFLHVAGDSLRSLILGAYPEGSKLREMVQSELDLITKNQKRRLEVEKGRVATVEAFMERLRATLAANPDLYEQVITKQAEGLGVTPPASTPQAA